VYTCTVQAAHGFGNATACSEGLDEDDEQRRQKHEHSGKTGQMRPGGHNPILQCHAFAILRGGDARRENVHTLKEKAGTLMKAK
jgi:hypothetical protein